MAKTEAAPTDAGSRCQLLQCSSNTEDQCRALPVEVLERIFGFLGADTWSIGASAQVCRQWRDVCRHPQVWAQARMLLRNPEWKLMDADAPPLRCFFVLENDARAKGVYFMTTAQQAVVRALQIRRVILKGPNILKEAGHLYRLAQELPDMRELVLARCELSTAAFKVLLTEFSQLETLVISEWTSLGSLFLLFGKASLRTLIIHACKLDIGALPVYLHAFRHLRLVNLSGCHPRHVKEQLLEQYANLRFDDTFSLPDARRPYGATQLSSALGSTRQSDRKQQPWHDTSWWDAALLPDLVEH